VEQTGPREIGGERVSLRQFESADGEELSEVVTDNIDHLRPWMEWASAEPLTRDERIALIERWAESDDLNYGVYVRGSLIGVCGFMHRIGDGGVEIGYWLAEARTGRGHITEAAGLLTTLAFSDPTIDRVEIHHDKANTASAGVPRRLGYRLISEEADKIKTPAEIGIECIWRTKRADWRPEQSGS